MMISTQFTELFTNYPYDNNMLQSEMNCCYLCPQCASSFESLAELETHLSSAHNDDIDQPAEDNLDISDTSSPGNELISNTSSPVENGPRLFPCRFCGKLFDSRPLLNIHYTHTHRDKPQYECDVCFKIFSVKRELATHRRIHSGEQTHICAQCGKEFGTRQLLKKHWMWHTGERSHVCPHCGKAFFQKGHLTQHLMIHAGGRPHVCNLCQKTFIFKFDLNRHMKIHAERGFNCDRCGRAFLKQSAFTDHQSMCIGAPIEDAKPPEPKPETPRAPSRRKNKPQTPEQQPPKADQSMFCFLCMKQFNSQAAYTLHVSFVHLRNAQLSTQEVSNGSELPDSTMDSSGSGAECKKEELDDCLLCQATRHKLAEMERAVALRDSEIVRLRETMRRVGSVASGLLESCSDFDKLWMLHSKKVYTQIQSVLNSLE